MNSFLPCEKFSSAFSEVPVIVSDSEKESVKETKKIIYLVLPVITI
jgi:hypothetical protein